MLSIEENHSLDIGNSKIRHSSILNNIFMERQLWTFIKNLSSS